VSQVQILVVDNCQQWRETLRSMLEAIPGYQVVAEAGDALEAIQKAAQLHPEIVLLDIGMPILNGIEAASRIRRASPDTKIVFVTQENDRDIRTAALATGAEGYLLKSRVVFDLIPAVDALAHDADSTAGVLGSSNGHDARALSRD
jgi:DNA-binding NarL/FixJ family response regulator